VPHGIDGEQPACLHRELKRHDERVKTVARCCPASRSGSVRRC
jgi:hypothetical protein